MQSDHDELITSRIAGNRFNLSRELVSSGWLISVRVRPGRVVKHLAAVVVVTVA
jgi:hypothetical protein